MVFISLIKESLAALWGNKLRSSLTTLGMIMGVTSVIAIILVVEGLQSNLDNFFDSLGTNTFIVSRTGFTITWEEYIKRMKRKKLTRALIPLVEEGCPDCEMVGAEGYDEDRVKYKNRSVWQSDILGQTPNVEQMRNIEIIMGRNISWEDEYRRKKVAVIGNRVHEKLFPDEDPLGKRIKIGSSEFIVIGVLEKRDNSLAIGWDNNIVIPLSTMQKLYRQPGNPVVLVIKSTSLESRERAIEQVRSVLRSVRRLPFGDDDDFDVMTPDSILSFFNDVTRAYRVIMIAMPLLSIIIGGIVIMNIMMISVTERTREIGIRKSIGARKRHILVQFLYESLIISFLGSGIGTFVGFKVGGLMLTSLLDIYVIPASMAIFFGIGIAVCVGLFFGIYPARKAAGFDPVKALAYE